MRRFVWDDRGEGLTGLLIALLIVSLFAAFAVPRLWRVGAALRLDGEAAQLATELMRYRETVITLQSMHKDFSEVGEEAQPKFELNADGYGTRESGMDVFWHPLPKDVKLICSGKVDFRRTGNAQPLTITLRLGKEERYVIVDTVGRVRVSLTPPKE